MVMETHRTSSILRAIQSQSVLKNKQSQRNSMTNTPFETIETPTNRNSVNISMSNPIKSVERPHQT